MPTNQPPLGDFGPTTNIWDVEAEIASTVDINSIEFRELLIRLYQNLNYISTSLNARDSGYYPIEQLYANGQLFFPNPANDSTSGYNNQVWRQVYRKVIPCGALPNAATTTTAHGIAITDAYTFTRIYGCASDTTDLLYVPLPYASNTANDNIELSVNSTDVVIKTASDWSAYTITNVVLEWITQ